MFHPGRDRLSCQAQFAAWAVELPPNSAASLFGLSLRSDLLSASSEPAAARETRRSGCRPRCETVHLKGFAFASGGAPKEARISRPVRFFFGGEVRGPNPNDSIHLWLKRDISRDWGLQFAPMPGNPTQAESEGPQRQEHPLFHGF